MEILGIGLIFKSKFLKIIILLFVYKLLLFFVIFVKGENNDLDFLEFLNLLFFLINNLIYFLF